MHYIGIGLATKDDLDFGATKDRNGVVTLEIGNLLDNEIRHQLMGFGMERIPIKGDGNKKVQHRNIGLNINNFNKVIPFCQKLFGVSF